MTRFVSVCLASVAAIGVGEGVARAQGAGTDIGELPGGAKVTWPRVFIHEPGQTEEIEPTEPDTLRRYFNLAHCTCGQLRMGAEQIVYYDVGFEGQLLQRPGEIWVGSACEDNTNRDRTCRKVGDIPDLTELAISEARIQVSSYDLINGPESAPPERACQRREGDAFVWVIVDSNSTSPPEYFSPRRVDLAKFQDVSGIDTEPPPSPGRMQAIGGDKEIKLSWRLEETRQDDLYAYQALCFKLGDGAPAPLRAADEALYQRTTDVCGLSLQEPGNDTIRIDSVDVPDDGFNNAITTIPAPFATLDPAFICGTREQSTATTLDIEGLENGTEYAVALVTMDRSGNAVATWFNRTIVPQALTDLWEDFDDSVDGGFCLLAETYGDSGPITEALRSFRDHTLADTAYGRALIDAYYATLGRLGVHVADSVVLRVVAAIVLAPLVVLALAWHVLTLPGLIALLAVPLLWRRRRRIAERRTTRAALAAAAAIVVLAPGLAAADDFTPYWEDESGEAALDVGDDDVRWHVGIRVGPYVPAIDDKLGVNPDTGLGPYEEMFGTYFTGPDMNGGLTEHGAHAYQILPMLDVERVVWRGFGHLAVGGSIGYMQKSAYPYEDAMIDSDPDDGIRERSTSGRTTFRLIPFALTASYRLTVLDDNYGIPVVPYVRAGLAYYAWWINGSDGSIARVCADGSDDIDSCELDRATGASLGVVGSLGLSIRAERIDASTARAMRQSGINHAGFYGELSFAQVDGFGAASKLSVGAKTWFAGLDFEF